MQQASQKRNVSPSDLAVVYSGLDRMDEASRLLDQALEQRTPWLVGRSPARPAVEACHRRVSAQVRLPPGT